MPSKRSFIFNFRNGLREQQKPEKEVTPLCIYKGQTMLWTMSSSSEEQQQQQQEQEQQEQEQEQE